MAKIVGKSLNFIKIKKIIRFWIVRNANKNVNLIFSLGVQIVRFYFVLNVIAVKKFLIYNLCQYIMLKNK
jgi:hypothetical protein